MNDNDIIYNNYGPDLLGTVQKIIDALWGTGQFNDLFAWLASVWQVYTVIAFILSFIFIIGIVYSYIRFNHLGQTEMNQLLEAERLWQEQHGNGREVNTQWQQIQAHIASDNPNDWRLAIIEADIMLESVLESAGFAGNTIAEKLKSASPTNFTTVQDAWDAHLIRNKIAHQGADFIMTQRVANEAIAKFQRVFREFGVV